MDRLYSIAIGGIVAVLVNVLVFPIWSGEQLHEELVGYFACVADALEECVGKYLEDDGSERREFTKTVMDDFPDEPAYRKCRSTLNSSAKLDSLANSAKWEPPHGKFANFLYPWSQYVKVGTVLRYCTYEVMALHGVLHSEIQAPYNLRIVFQKEIQDATNEAAELIRCLGQDISKMQQTLITCILKRIHSSTERLQRAMDMHSYLLTSTHETSVNYKLSRLSQTSSSMFSNDLSNQMADFDNKYLDQDSQLPSQPSLQRQYSWPSREVDGLDGLSEKWVPTRMRAALSLATFASLLVEFVARLDHLVETVDELSKLAKFKQEAV